MAELDLSKATTTDFTNKVEAFIVDAKALDVDNKTGETFWYFSEATKNFGYYFEIPEIHSSANSLANWAFARGFETDPKRDTRMEVILGYTSGIGNDTFEIVMWNMQVVKKVVGDAFAEIIKIDGELQNLKVISPERVRLVLEKGLIKRYDVWNGKKWKEVKKEDMLHLSNNRIGDQVHGTSQIDACKWIIDARNEALISNRMIERRGRALGIAYYDTDNTGKITFANTQIEKAVNKGEMLGLPKDTVEIKEFPTKSTGDRIAWITYLENFFYQTFGVPRSIATSEGTSEVGGINGHLIFEPIYVKEQLELEKDLWNQVAIKIKFTRPPSLAPKTQENAEKNTGQLAIQPSEVEPKLNR